MITINNSPVDDELIDFVIKEEGFNTSPKDIGDGKLTLGSGLTEKKWHELYKQRGNVWSKEDNRNAVKEELINRYNWALKNIPNFNYLPDSAQKALLSYKYNYDFNAKNSPKLYAALKARDYRTAASEMNATSKNPKLIDGLNERRAREQKWFMQDLNRPKYITKEPQVSTRRHNPYIQESTRMYKPKMQRTHRYNYQIRGALDDQTNYKRFMESIKLQNNVPQQFFRK